VRICVIDTGKGITEEQLEDIFQPFNRLNAGVNIEGTGIGLSISKQLIEMMNGKIGVNSKVGEGSEFWIELNGKLDLQTTMEKESKTPSSQAAINGEAKPDHLILVAEDNPANQALILSQLEALGYSAELARNGQEALNMLVHNSYQLLITDCNMPLVDGYKLAKTIRERSNNSMPIIALTADAFPEKKAECLKAGMNDQITKPVNLESLKTMLEKYLN
jgi:CheY-like chemotaxis protein